MADKAKKTADIYIYICYFVRTRDLITMIFKIIICSQFI